MAEPSAALRAFVAEAPLERAAILAFVAEAAAALPRGSRVLDAGAGDAPYRELFGGHDYVTADWSNSPHAGGRDADVVAPLDALPLRDASFDAVVCTQVLEHVPRPATVLAELGRVLRPGGRLWLTVPFVGELHEEPFDFYRYTPYALRELLAEAGFRGTDVRPLGGYFTALAQLSRNCGPAIGAAGQGDLARRAVAAAGRLAARALPALDRLDRRRALPVGWACTAARAAGQPAAASSAAANRSPSARQS
jgi:SAM-dependent methyltransferase